MITMADEFDPYGLPPEVTSHPNALVGMMGLDIQNKSTHKSVWEAFAMNRRADRTPLHFRLLTVDFQMPPMKQKRQSYEWYIPKGILKSNWITKYLCKVPSLVVLFFDLDWNDANWTEKKNELATKVHTLKTMLGGRNSRVALVLIQSGISVPGEDTGAAEKAATLCTACDLPAKHLFVLPHSDAHLLGYTVRLENALSEVAWTFYQGEIKGVRAHRDFLNKTNHTLLFVRHQFKLGILNELRNDPQTAIKHYAQSYHHLLELRSTDTNLHEIRMVAAIINYKICRLDFSLNLPRDAIAQFRRHIDLFRQRTGPKDLIFEHYAWLSKQYHIFGDVFEEAVRLGLPAVQTQHPGFYYQQSAHYAVLRRKTALQVCKNVSAPVSDLLEGWDKLEFYGQRPWRPGKHSLEPPEQEREMEGIKEVQYHEVKEVNHSNIIIPLFSSAISQFKKYRCPCIKRHLMVQMAEEYYQANDPSKALTLLNHVMWDYRNEKWWSLLSSISTLALQCAYSTNAITEYIGLSLEFMGPRLQASDEGKQRVHDNLMKLLNGQPPDAEPGIMPEIISSSTEAWSRVFESQVSPITVDMTTLVPCLEVRASFKHLNFHIDQQVVVSLKIRNTCLSPLMLSSVGALTNFPLYNDWLIETRPELLTLPPKEVTEIQLSFKPSVEDVGKKIKLTGIRAQLGSKSSKVVVGLHWSGPGNEGVTLNTGNAPAFKEFSLLCEDAFDTCIPIAETEILPRQPKLTVTVNHDPITLVWEWLPVTIHFKNSEEFPAMDICLNFGLSLASHANLEHTTQICTSPCLQGDKLTSQISNLQIGDLSVGEETSVTFYIKCLTSAERTCILKMEYMVTVSSSSSSIQCPCVHEETIQLQAKIPFQVTLETQSMKFEKITKVAGAESFAIVSKIKCTSHVPILLTNSSLALAGEAQQVGVENVSHIIGTELAEDEVGVDCFCIAVSRKVPSNTAVTLGQYFLYWRRASDDSPEVSVSVGLPSVVVEHWGIWVECILPPQGILRTPLVVTYVITNRAQNTTECALTMQASDAFMYAGHKELRLRMLPSREEKVTYVLYPLLSGNVQLPKLGLSVESHSPGQPTSLETLLTRILPTHIYIMPQAKGEDAAVMSLTKNFAAVTAS